MVEFLKMQTIEVMNAMKPMTDQIIKNGMIILEKASICCCLSSGVISAVVEDD